MVLAMRRVLVTGMSGLIGRAVRRRLEGRAVLRALNRRPVEGVEPHRADIAKMLVHRRARKRGVGAALMRAAEDAARKAGKTVLVLDTVTGSDAERLYTRLGWQKSGIIPNYALWPQGGLCDTTVFHKQLPGT